MDRRQFLALAGAGVLATACSGRASTPAVRERVTVGLTYLPNVQFSPFYLAEDNQEFLSRGLDASLRHHGATEGLFDALLAGTEHVVLAGGDELLQARSAGADLVAISSYYRTFPGEIIARSDAGIATLADLKGRRVGIPGRYGETWFALQVALATAGLAESDVQITEIGYTAQAAMQGAKVDAVVGFANNDAVQLKLAGVPIREIGLGQSVPLVSASLITTRKFLSDRPVVARSVVAAMLAGMRAAVQNPAAAVTATATRLPAQDATAQRAARATMDATLPLLAAPDGKVDGRLDPQAWDAMSTFMVSRRLLPALVPAAQAMTNDVVTP